MVTLNRYGHSQRSRSSSDIKEFICRSLLSVVPADDLTETAHGHSVTGSSFMLLLINRMHSHVMRSDSKKGSSATLPTSTTQDTGVEAYTGNIQDD